MTAPTTDRPTKGTGKKRSNAFYVVIMSIVVVAVVALGTSASNYHTHRYQDGFSHGYNAGVCDQKGQGVQDGYSAYMNTHNLGFVPKFSGGARCNQVFVVLTKVTKGDGHVTTTTCKRTEILLPDGTHPLPYTKGTKCTTTDVSTHTVGIGQPVGGG